MLLKSWVCCIWLRFLAGGCNFDGGIMVGSGSLFFFTVEHLSMKEGRKEKSALAIIKTPYY